MSAGMLEPLARILRGEREKAGVLQVEVAARAGVSRPVITRFERHQTVPEVGLDTLVSAYASECGVRWLELWEAALAEARKDK
jgi:transcriptional regulator with XRE-family HTH domain